MEINARTLKSLEWERLKHYLVSECSSDCSRELALNLQLHDDFATISSVLQEAEEAQFLLQNDGKEISQEGLPDFREQIKRVFAGAPLSAGELLDLKAILQLSRKLKILLSNLDEEKYRTLRKNSGRLFVLDPIVNAIDAIIDDDGGIRDDASPLLRRLRREVQRYNARIKDELLRIINSPAGGKCLQEPIFTIRNGRHVLPVLASMRHSIEGIVHDSSSTGLTIFVEPKSVVELTNSIRLNESEIEREIDRLLRELSALAAKHITEIEQSFLTLVEADFIAARARLARKYKGTCPTISKTNELDLRHARHPLLVLQFGSTDKVIPNDIRLNNDLRTLIITGPNTGGKTVYMKTAGLLSLMVRAGLLLPVSEGSIASVFHSVFADIGDEQSLEQNLSTFSSHMGNIVEITRRADAGTLILLDEIGAGTDPREGVALARVILEHLTNTGSYTICSTHYGDLKTLAHSETGYVNASMEFDDKTLTPSYRMRHGVAGNSHALAVAARLGLAADLVSEAQLSLDSEKQDFEHKIDQLEQRLRILTQQEDEFAIKKEHMLEQEAELQDKLRALADEHRRSRSEADNRFQEDYRKAQKMINELTANLQKTPSLARAQQAKERLDTLKKELDWLGPEEYAAAQAKIEPGKTVKVRSLNQFGVIEELVDANNARVRVGRLKVKVALSDLEISLTQPVKTNRAQQMPVSAKKAHQDKAASLANTAMNDPVFVRGERNTLDLRGQRVDEGINLLARFIDEAYLAHLSPLMVIHGHGTGAMKSAVREFLHSCSYQNKSRPGEPYEGGDGVTVINFK